MQSYCALCMVSSNPISQEPRKIPVILTVFIPVWLVESNLALFSYLKATDLLVKIMSLQTSCLQPLSLIQYPSICPLIFLYSSDVTSKFSLPTREKCCESSHGMNYSKACFILHCIEMTRNKNNFKMFKKKPLEGYLAY